MFDGRARATSLNSVPQHKMDDEAVDTSMEDGISFAVIMGFLATLAIAIVLSLIGGAAGWVAGGGLMSTKFNAGTLIGAASGFALGGCLG